MSIFGLVQLAASTAVFLLAGTLANFWAQSPSVGKLVGTLALYTLGNLIMLRLIREFGMATAFSLSAVIQLVSLNIVAFFAFNERVGAIQGAGIALAVVSVALITLGPILANR